VSAKGIQLWRLPVGARFEDFGGKQTFEKTGEVVTKRGKRHQLKCVDSPFTKLPGPVCAAFFCAIGDVVYREGSLRVFPKEAA